MHPTFSPINANAITKSNILRFFRRQHTKAQALERFDCVRRTKDQVIESERHVNRFNLLFQNLIAKNKIATRDHGRFQTVVGNERSSEPRNDDAEAPL